jgi:hypothetical protein
VIIVSESATVGSSDVSPQGRCDVKSIRRL